MIALGYFSTDGWDQCWWDTGNRKMAMNWTVKVRPGIWTDPRFRLLERRSTDRWQAIGKLVEFWQLAQGHWAVGENIPETSFKFLDMPEIVECGFAVQLDDGSYRARGDEEHFQWLKAQRERSEKGVLARRAKNNPKSTPSQPDGQPQVNRTVNRTVTHELEQEQELEQEENIYTSSRPSDEIAPTPPAPKGGAHILADIWNQETNGLPKSRLLNKKRIAAANARLKEVPDLDDWRRCARAINARPFCRGVNDRGWKASFEYFVRQETIVKFLEGSFDEQPVFTGRTRPSSFGLADNGQTGWSE